MNPDHPEMKLARRAAACEGALIGPWRSERLDRYGGVPDASARGGLPEVVAISTVLQLPTSSR